MTAPGTTLGIINRFVDVDFLVDLGLNFRTGYFDERQHLVLEPRAAALHYLKTWFLLDFVSSMPPVVELIAYLAGVRADGGNQADIVKVTRVLKIVRGARAGSPGR